MKKILAATMMLASVVACTLPGSQILETPAPAAATAAPAAQDTPAAAINAPVVLAPAISSLHMLDEVNGWAVDATQILRTNDGAVTWYDVTPPGLSSAGYNVGAEFLDVQHAWIQVPDQNNYPTAGTLYRTSDGGITWTSNAVPFSGGYFAFLDASNGWIMADFGAGAGSNAIAVFQTTDAGANWTRTYTNDPTVQGAADSLPLGGLKYGINALNMQTAWIHGVTYAPGEAYLFRTDDAGHTWAQVNVPLSGAAQTGDLSVDGVAFPTTTDGVVELRLGGDPMQTMIYASSDSGATWHLAPGILTGAGSFVALSATDMIYYFSNTFYITHDGAQTWTSVASNLAFGDNFASMDFASLNVGWVLTADASDHHSLFKSTDGGATWTALIP